MVHTRSQSKGLGVVDNDEDSDGRDGSDKRRRSRKPPRRFIPLDVVSRNDKAHHMVLRGDRDPPSAGERRRAVHRTADPVETASAASSPPKAACVRPPARAPIDFDAQRRNVAVDALTTDEYFIDFLPDIECDDEPGSAARAPYKAPSPTLPRASSPVRENYMIFHRALARKINDQIKALQKRRVSYVVSLNVKNLSSSTCDCEDFKYRRVPCKHIYLVAIHCGYIDSHTSLVPHFA